MIAKKPASLSHERARGRPADSGQQSLKIQLLDNAEVLFSSQGYAATSIRQIADSVGVNPALIHYYFGNKKALLGQVMKRVLKPLVEALASLKTADRARPQDIAVLFLSMARKHPNIPSLMTREVLLPGGEMQDFFIQNLAPRLGGALPSLLKREQSAGRLRDDFDPAVSALLVLALSVFPFVARALAEPVLGIDSSTDGLDVLTQHITGLLTKGMTQ